MNIETAQKESIIYEDEKLYVCLASEPITEGHTLVIWKKDVSDLRLLSLEEYDHLMNIVDITRNAMISALKVKKVYLIYMDEAKHVHWHLVPRYNEKGFDIFRHQPEKIKEFPSAPIIKQTFIEVLRNHEEFIEPTKVLFRKT